MRGFQFARPRVERDAGAVLERFEEAFEAGKVNRTEVFRQAVVRQFVIRSQRAAAMVEREAERSEARQAFDLLGRQLQFVFARIGVEHPAHDFQLRRVGGGEARTLAVFQAHRLAKHAQRLGHVGFGVRTAALAMHQLEDAAAASADRKGRLRDQFGCPTGHGFRVEVAQQPLFHQVPHDLAAIPGDAAEIDQRGVAQDFAVFATDARPEIVERALQVRPAAVCGTAAEQHFGHLRAALFGADEMLLLVEGIERTRPARQADGFQDLAVLHQQGGEEVAPCQLHRPAPDRRLAVPDGDVGGAAADIEHDIQLVGDELLGRQHVAARRQAFRERIGIVRVVLLAHRLQCLDHVVVEVVALRQSQRLGHREEPGAGRGVVLLAQQLGTGQQDELREEVLRRVLFGRHLRPLQVEVRVFGRLEEVVEFLLLCPVGRRLGGVEEDQVTENPQLFLRIVRQLGDRHRRDRGAARFGRQEFGELVPDVVQLGLVHAVVLLAHRQHEPVLEGDRLCIHVAHRAHRVGGAEVDGDLGAAVGFADFCQLQQHQPHRRFPPLVAQRVGIVDRVESGVGELQLLDEAVVLARQAFAEGEQRGFRIVGKGHLAAFVEVFQHAGSIGAVGGLGHDFAHQLGRDRPVGPGDLVGKRRRVEEPRQIAVPRRRTEIRPDLAVVEIPVLDRHQQVFAVAGRLLGIVPREADRQAVAVVLAREAQRQGDAHPAVRRTGADGIVQVGRQQQRQRLDRQDHVLQPVRVTVDHRVLGEARCPVGQQVVGRQDDVVLLEGVGTQVFQRRFRIQHGGEVDELPHQDLAGILAVRGRHRLVHQDEALDLVVLHVLAVELQAHPGRRQHQAFGPLDARGFELDLRPQRLVQFGRLGFGIGYLAQRFGQPAQPLLDVADVIGQQLGDVGGYQPAVVADFARQLADEVEQDRQLASRQLDRRIQRVEQPVAPRPGKVGHVDPVAVAPRADQARRIGHAERLERQACRVLLLVLEHDEPRLAPQLHLSGNRHFRRQRGQHVGEQAAVVERDPFRGDADVAGVQVAKRQHAQQPAPLGFGPAGEFVDLLVARLAHARGLAQVFGKGGRLRPRIGYGADRLVFVVEGLFRIDRQAVGDGFQVDAARNPLPADIQLGDVVVALQGGQVEDLVLGHYAPSS